VSALNRNLSSETAANACSAIAHLADDRENIAALFKSGACEAVIGAMNRYSNVPHVLEMASLAISHLCSDDTCLELIVEAGGCSAVSTSLEKFKSDKRLVEQACLSLWHLCSSDKSQSKLGAAGACEAVVGALEFHIGETGDGAGDAEAAHATAQALAAVWNFADDEENFVRLGSNICNLVVQGLRKYGSTDAGVAEHGCAAVLNIGMPNTERRSELGKEGACQAIVDALQSHLKNPRVAEQACLAVRMLASGGTNNDNRTTLGDSGVCELILEVLVTHTSDPSVAVPAAAAIWNLVTDHLDNKLKFVEAGGVDCLVQLLSNFPSNFEVAEQGSLALWALAGEDDFFKRVIKSKLGKAGVVEVLSWGEPSAKALLPED
jgi:hypothetical protein